METRIDKCLAQLRKWAEGRVAAGNEPPWAWYQYMKLIETVAAIQTGRASVAPSAAAVVAGRATPQAPRPRDDGVADINTQRRRRRRDDPPLPM